MPQVTSEILSFRLRLFALASSLVRMLALVSTLGLIPETEGFTAAPAPIRHDRLEPECRRILTAIEIHTPRLLIRAIDESALAEVTAILTHPWVAAVSGDRVDPQAISSTLSSGQMTLPTQPFRPGMFINFGIYEDAKLIGTCQIVNNGFALIDGPDRALNNGNQWAEISYHLHPSAWNRGIATEVVRELVRYAIHQLKISGVQAEVLEKNEASQRVLLRAGFKEIGRESLFDQENQAQRYVLFVKFDP